MKRKCFLPHPIAFATVCPFVFFAVSCADDERSMAGSEHSVDEPLYAVSSTVFSPEGDVSYVSLVSSLEDEELDYRDAFETAGGAFMYPIEGDAPAHAVFLGLVGDVGIRRVDITEDGRFEPGQTMALSQLGVTYPPYEGVLFLGEEKAWVVDFWEQLQVVVWNPRTMEVERTFATPELARDGHQPVLGRLRHLHGSRYVAPVAWYAYANEAALPLGGAAIFDVEDERLVTVLEDPRCAGLENAVRGPDGHTYLVSGGYAAALTAFLRPELPTSCALRIAAEQESFDPDFVADLKASAGGRATGLIMPGPNGAFWINVWHEERYASTPSFDTRNDVEAWRWWRLELPSARLVEEPRLPWHGGAAQAFLTAGHTYSSLVAADYSGATLYDMSAPEAPQPGLRVRGGLYGIAQIRTGSER